MAVRDLKPVRWLIRLAQGSPWLMMAIGLHVILAAAMSVIVIHRERAKAHAGATQIAVVVRPEPIQQLPQPPEEIDRQKIPENELRAELVTPEEEQRTFVPTVEVEEDLRLDIGDPTGTDDGSEAFTGGTSIGVGSGGHHGTGIPSPFVMRGVGSSNRGLPGRQLRGPSVSTEQAVLEGLRWLIRHQEEDGSWSPATLARHCTAEKACIPAVARATHNFDEGLTGLALLCFLGQGISVGSKIEIVDTALGRRHRAGEVVKKGIKWLIERQEDDGFLANPDYAKHMYNEALASMALFEAYGLSRNRELKRPAQRAVDTLVAAQKLNPEGQPWGWRYFSKAHLDAALAAGKIDPSVHDRFQDVDISVTGWVVMALKSAQMAGLEVPPESMQGALAYAISATGSNGLVGYQSAGQAGQRITGPGGQFADHSGTLSALGMLVRTFVSHDLDDPFLEPAATHIVKDLPVVSKDKLSIDYYYWYYATLALNQYDGPDSPRKGSGSFWEPWNEALVAAILPLQDQTRTRDVCSRGAWLDDDRWGGHTGYALYNTALNVLTLEVYYRYENAFGAIAMAKRPK